MIAFGVKDGRIKVWHTRTGQCLRCLECAHSQGVTVLLSLVMEASCELHRLTTQPGIHGLKSSNDCTVKVWDMKSTDCMHTFRPPPPLRGGDASVNSVHLFPKNTYHIVVCNKTSSVCIMTLQGQGA
ncbi:hypothetical protein OIU77_015593 [Salix suchowensis]|uniref:Uncharacterized protein n=1 Tax=Salix suchowensis TaxID=1278906 RepID=A0ABQ8ZHS1_9ROSI|nr:hypothetical protein OIU77_015593 [Salix suchowensis]